MAKKGKYDSYSYSSRYYDDYDDWGGYSGYGGYGGYGGYNYGYGYSKYKPYQSFWNKKKEKTLHTIDQLAYDYEIYDEVYYLSSKMQERVEQGEKILNAFPELAQDIFMSLYKYKPTIKDKNDIYEAVHFNREMMQELMVTKEYQKLRSHTKLDQVASAMASEVFIEEVHKKIDEMKDKMNKEHEENPDANPTSGDQFFQMLNDLLSNTQAKDKLDDYASRYDNYANTGKWSGGSGLNGFGSPSTGMTPEEAKQAAEQIRQQSGDIQKLLDQASQSINDPSNLHNMRELHNQLRNAAKVAEKEVKEVSDLIQAWGLGGGDNNSRVSYEEKKDAMDSLRSNKKLRDIGKLLGRFKKLAKEGLESNSTDGYMGIQSVRTGDNIQDALPSEKMLLANNTTKKLFFQRYSEKQLLQYDRRNRVPMGQGPIICCVDMSGSMSGKSEVWSKAVSLAMLEIAHHQRRNFAYIGFDHRVQNVEIIERGSLKPKQLLDIAEVFSSGGTDFTEPLTKALEVIEMNKFKKADILFITDGQCGVSQEFLDEFANKKKEKDFKVHSVLIDCSYASRGAIKDFSDKITLLSDLTEKNAENSAKDIFQTVK